MRTVLVVDDSPSIRNIVRVFLSGTPYDVIEAENGDRALQLVKLMRVDAVLADLNMPKLDGFALTRALRESALERLRTLPVVLLTGEAHRTRQEAVSHGVTDFLRKPISGRELVQALDSVFQDRDGHGAPAAR